MFAAGERETLQHQRRQRRLLVTWPWPIKQRRVVVGGGASLQRPECLTWRRKQHAEHALIGHARVAGGADELLSTVVFSVTTSSLMRLLGRCPPRKVSSNSYTASAG